MSLYLSGLNLIGGMTNGMLANRRKSRDFSPIVPSPTAGFRVGLLPQQLPYRKRKCGIMRRVPPASGCGRCVQPYHRPQPALFGC